jgi:hypothetical protein
MFVDIPVITKIAGLCPLLFCCGCFLILVVKFPIGIKIYLKNYQNTFAIYMGSEGSAWGKVRIIKFTTHDNITVRAEVNYVSNLNVGDTIWIKYSKVKPEIAEIIDRDYKKYLKKNRGDIPD